MMELSTSTRADALTEWTAPRAKLDGISALDHLFNRLDGMYPGSWRKNFTTEQSIENWKAECEQVFIEEGVTLAQIATGLRECRRLHPGWPPTVPQFANACNPPVDPVQSYHEALAGLEARGKGEVGVWSHPAIFWAATGLSRDLALQPGQFMKDRWAAALKAQLARGAWDPIPPPRVLLPAPGKSQTGPEDAQRMLAKLGALGITKTAKAAIDGKRWARRIMERLDAGDKTLKPFQVKEARIALGINTETEDGES